MNKSSLKYKIHFCSRLGLRHLDINISGNKIEGYIQELNTMGSDITSVTLIKTMHILNIK